MLKIYLCSCICSERGIVAQNQTNNYAGPIYVQDVDCTGFETHPSQCNVSTYITSDCVSSSSIVRIYCFITSKQEKHFSMLILLLHLSYYGRLLGFQN